MLPKGIEKTSSVPGLSRSFQLFGLGALASPAAAGWSGLTRLWRPAANIRLVNSFVSTAYKLPYAIRGAAEVFEGGTEVIYGEFPVRLRAQFSTPDAPRLSSLAMF